MNKVILLGRLTRDPEISKPKEENTQAVARYTLAVNRLLGNGGKEEVDYFNCVAFGARADFAENYLKKGMRVIINGRLHSSTYTNKDGQKQYSVDVIVDELYFAETRRNDNTDRKVQGGAE